MSLRCCATTTAREHVKHARARGRTAILSPGLLLVCLCVKLDSRQHDKAIDRMSTLLLAALGTRAAVPFGNDACLPARSVAPAAAETAEGPAAGIDAALGPLLLSKPGGGTGVGAADGRPGVLFLVLAKPGADSVLRADAAAAAGAVCPFLRARLLPASTGPAWA